MTTPSSQSPDTGRRSWLGWGLIAYGVLGLAVVIVGAFVAMAGAQRLERTLAAVDGTLEAAAGSTRAVARLSERKSRGTRTASARVMEG